MAPYQASIAEVVTRFGGTPERKEILTGLLDFRAELRSAGILNGFQWIDGSFFENCETIHNRPPRDMDVVTFAQRPSGFSSPADWHIFFNMYRPLFDRNVTKSKYKCDAYYVDLGLPATTIVSRTRYWFGLFSHQRDTYLWKGMVEISLSGNDSGARALIGGSANAP